MPLDMSAATAPPKKSAGTRTSNRKAPAPLVTEPEPNASVNRRAEGMNGIAQIVQAGCLMFGQYADAAAIGQFFPPISKELAQIAETNEAISKPIDFLIEIGPYGGLIAAVLPFGLQIAANHGWADASRLMGQGVVPPAVLDAQMKTQMMQMQAEALRAQNAAVAAANAAQKEMQDALREQQEANA